jgi:hypothetical protein
MKNKIILTIILSIIILILSGCINGTTTPNIPDQGDDINHKPIISDLPASPRTAFINQNITITCTASDQDGDTLAYSWSSSPGGTINGIGSNITWKAPAIKGTYTITCLVSDGKGGEDSKSVGITVASDSGGVRYSISWSEAGSNGWKNPLGEGKELITSTAYDYDSGIYLYNHSEIKHMGIDIVSEENDMVYAIADGTVDYVFTEDSWYDKDGILRNRSVIIIKHTNSENGNLFAIYGHVLAKDELKSTVKAGEKIGVVKISGSPCHLHFGVNLSSEFIDDLLAGKCGWGLIPESDNPSEYGWVEPIDYLNTHSIENIVLGSITVIPSTMSLVEGDSQTISSITAHYSDGSTADIALNDCTYDSSNTGIATVDAGVITSVASGIATINLSYTEGDITKNDTVEVTVTPVTKTYIITASAGSHGSINPSGNITVNQGSDKAFTITPNNGYSINDVLVDGSSVGAVSSYTFSNVIEDHTISATFSLSTVTGPVHNLTKDTYYNTIQEALDDADSGNTIEVSDGTYDESITSPSFPSGKVIILQSANGASSTTIRGDGGSPTVALGDSLEGTTLEGFTITHVSGNYGRGIYNDANLTIKNCTISNNTHGGGISNGYSGTLTIIASTISSNSAVWLGGGINNYNGNGTLTIIASTISNNTAAESGGGIYNHNDGTLTITESIISGNTTYGSGGGIDNFNGTLTITGSTISGNSAESGGGISNSNGTLTITGSTISDNTAGAGGGGIYNEFNGTLTIIASTISNNTAAESGGGISNSNGTLTITGSMISDNTVGGGGGGIYLSSSENINVGGENTADKNTICGNYKTGEVPSLDQQIRNGYKSLYETYKDTNYISAYCE